MRHLDLVSLHVYQKYHLRILQERAVWQIQNCFLLQFLMICSGHIQMVYILQLDVEQIQGQLILSILIYSHDEPNLGKCHIEYNFGIVGSNFLSIQGKCRAYQGAKKKGKGPGKRGSD